MTTQTATPAIDENTKSVLPRQELKEGLEPKWKYYNAAIIQDSETCHYLTDYLNGYLTFHSEERYAVPIELKSLTDFMRDLSDSLKDRLQYDLIHVDKPEDHVYKSGEMYERAEEEQKERKVLYESIVQLIEKSPLNDSEKHDIWFDMTYKSDFFRNKFKY